jgi:hypothetical protein
MLLCLSTTPACHANATARDTKKLSPTPRCSPGIEMRHNRATNKNVEHPFGGG